MNDNLTLLETRKLKADALVDEKARRHAQLVVDGGQILWTQAKRELSMLSAADRASGYMHGLGEYAYNRYRTQLEREILTLDPSKERMRAYGYFNLPPWGYQDEPFEFAKVK